MKNMIIIAGARSGIGKAYLEYFKEDAQIVEITRTQPEHHKNSIQLVCDLTDRKSSENLFRDLDLSKTDRITLIHCIGDDVFECKTYPKITIKDTIHPLVYTTNVNTLKNVIDALIQKIEQYRTKGKNIIMTTVMFGAITDKYNIPFFTSFRESKKISKLYLENIVRRYKWTRSFVVNVSTVKTKLSVGQRPLADTTYWLNPKEVVDKSIDKILNMTQHFEEIEIFKFDPNFEQDYYINHKKIYEKWMKEMGCN